MPAALHDPNAVPTLLLLIGLELILGVDNVVVVGVLSAGLPEAHRRAATALGLGFAVLLRIAALAGLTALMAVGRPLIGPVSIGDAVVFGGGLFLIAKAVAEIYRQVDGRERGRPAPAPGSFAGAVAQITALDIAFSVDSVMTAVGLTRYLLILVLAVLASFGIVLLAAQAVGAFVRRNPALRVLCFAFVLCIGASLVLEGLHQRFPRAYLYVPMAFAFAFWAWRFRRRC